MSQPQRFPFLVVEGSDGSGKTSLVTALTRKYIEAGVSCIPARNPAGTKLGAAVRALNVEVGEGDQPAPYAQLLLQIAAHAQLVAEKLIPNEHSSFVIFDRYLYSTIVYQGLMTGQYMPAFCKMFSELVQPLPQPELTIILQCRLDKLKERVHARRNTPPPAKPSRRKLNKKQQEAEQQARIAAEKDIMETDHALAAQTVGFSRPANWLPPNVNYMVVDTTDRTADEVADYVWLELQKLWPVVKDSEPTPELLAARKELSNYTT